LIASRSPINPLQAVVVALLRADSTLAGLLATVKNVSPATPAVVDNPPEGQAYPYVRIGDQLSTPDNDHDGFGREITLTLHIWTKTRSMGPGQAISERVGQLLDHQADPLSARLAAAGHRCVTIRQEFDQALTDPDPELRHHVIRFRVQTEQLN
jgi:hypothetical protein